MVIEFRGEPYEIAEFQHVNPGKGSAFVRTKLKALKTGRVIEFTFKSGESVEELSVVTREMQYLYRQAEVYIFMDSRSGEQYKVSAEILGDFTKYLREGDTYQVLVYNDEAVGLRLPKKVRLLVSEAEEGARGDTVSGGGTKIVTVETGLRVTVPLFIKKGDTIAIDTETGEYVERA